MIWATERNVAGCIYMVLASNHYDETPDYVRSYGEFVRLRSLPPAGPEYDFRGRRSRLAAMDRSRVDRRVRDRVALLFPDRPARGKCGRARAGVYCLRSNETSWTPEQMWRTYVMLTDLEAVFRSLKSELGLRPIFHHKESRSDAHLLISVLAYQFVQVIRTRLADRGHHHSWASLRQILRIQRRTTSRFNTRGGRTLSVRKASQPEAEFAQLDRALGLDPNPGGTKKLIT